MQQRPQDSLQNDPIFAFQDGVDEFTYYQKECGQNYKSRADKRKERVLKLTKYLHDPQQKKLKKEEQRKAQKNKIHQVIQHMTKEEARTYLDTVKKSKAQVKAKVRQAMNYGQVFMIDMAYQSKMNQKENRSLGKQVQLIMRGIKQFDQPPSIHICSFQGGIKQQMQKMGYQYWAVTTHSHDVTEVALKLGIKLVYLSPDAEKEMDSIEKDTGYILGGLVDRTVLKNASLKRAEELGIEARRLPIGQFMKGRLCLNLDHVINLMCKFKECKNWKQSFDYAAPKRWKKEQQTVKQTPQKNEKQNSFQTFEQISLDPSLSLNKKN